MGRLDPGARLGADLTLTQLLGAGGLAQAWLARDRARGTVVAKVIGPGAPEEGIAVLEHEWSIARMLAHPAIVPVFAFARESDLAWLTLEHVPGGDARRLRGAAAASVVGPLLPVVEALEYAHAHGIVHRDLKASNVLLDAEGRGRLTDFGCAVPLIPGPEAGRVGGGSRGSLSPQQLDGEPPHPADDVYGLGALVYDLVQGQPPFWPDFDPRRVRSEPPPPLSPAVPIPKTLADLVGAMLAPKREDRPGLPAVRAEFLSSLAELPLPVSPRSHGELVSLTAPPRPVVQARSGSAPAAAAPASASWRARGPAVSIFAALAVAAVAVFVYLPRWVAAPPVASDPRPAVPAAAPPTEAPSLPLATPATPANDTPTEPSRARPGTPAPLREPPSSAAPPSAVPNEAAWSRAVSEGLAAVARGEFAEARAAFGRAEAARPGTPAVADGLLRLEEGLKAEGLAQNRGKGEAAESREEWRAALAEYEAALGIEPAVAFALAGRARSRTRAELDERLSGYLQRPDRLSAEAVAREAEGVLIRAREIEPSGPRLAQQVAALQRLLTEARTPVDVRLLSDGLTEVAVLRVGSLGAFREKALPLVPGSYVVVGKRRGFRDVRRTLVVPRGGRPQPLLVRCDEAL